MTWKSYVLTGTGLVATLFAAAQPSRMPANVAPEQPREAVSVVAAASDIEEQAAHLQARLQQEPLYREPARNLFRFSERRELSRRIAAAAIQEMPEVSLPEASAPPPVKLSGIAEDGEGAAMVRTAVLSTPAGVVLAREGDEVLGRFRVSRIDADAVILTSVPDGTSLRLSF